MKPHYFKKMLVICLPVILAACGFTAPRDRDSGLVGVRVPDPDAQEAEGSWIGWGEGYDDLFLYRLTLTHNEAILGQDYLGRSKLYPGISWALVGTKLVLHVPGAGTNEVREVSATFNGSVITATVSGRSWQHKVILHNENRLEQRQRHLAAEMATQAGGNARR